MVPAPRDRLSPAPSVRLCATSWASLLPRHRPPHLLPLLLLEPIFSCVLAFPSSTKLPFQKRTRTLSTRGFKLFCSNGTPFSKENKQNINKHTGFRKATQVEAGAGGDVISCAFHLWQFTLTECAGQTAERGQRGATVHPCHSHSAGPALSL